MFHKDKERSVSELLAVSPKHRQLAKAIRRGCEIHPRQHRGWLWFVSASGRRVASCALGAAYDGGFMDEDFLKETHASCPVPDCRMFCNPHSRLQDTIVHLNDYHNLTREKIADWVETGR